MECKFCKQDRKEMYLLTKEEGFICNDCAQEKMKTYEFKPHIAFNPWSHANGGFIKFRKEK